MLKRNRTLLSLAAGSLILSGCDVPDREEVRKRQHLPAADFVANPENGKTLFQQHCASCHGVTIRGTDQGPPLIHHTYRPQHHADQTFHWAVKGGVKQHHWHFGNMPAQRHVSPEMAGDIIAYVRREQRKAGIR